MVYFDYMIYYFMFKNVCYVVLSNFCYYCYLVCLERIYFEKKNISVNFLNIDV